MLGVGMAGAAILVLNSMIGAATFALPAVVSITARPSMTWQFLSLGAPGITIVLPLAALASYLDH